MDQFEFTANPSLAFDSSASFSADFDWTPSAPSTDLLGQSLGDLPLPQPDPLAMMLSDTSSANHSPSSPVSSPYSESLSPSDCDWSVHDDTSSLGSDDIKIPPVPTIGSTLPSSSVSSFVMMTAPSTSSTMSFSSASRPAPLPLPSSNFAVLRSTSRPRASPIITTTVPAPAKRIAEPKAAAPKSAAASRKRTRKAAPAPVKQEAYQSSDEGGEGLTKRDRNKLSAAKYRKRRKMYMETLETKVSGLEKKVSTQSDKIKNLETENSMMREQLAFFRNLLSKTEGTLKPNNPKATAVMFVLFACLLMCTGHWQASQMNSVVSSIDDPSISSANNGRRLLSHGAVNAEGSDKADNDVVMTDAKPVCPSEGKVALPPLEMCNKSAQLVKAEDQKVQYSPEEKFVMDVFADVPASGAEGNATLPLPGAAAGEVVVKLEPAHFVPETGVTTDRML